MGEAALLKRGVRLETDRLPYEDSLSILDRGRDTAGPLIQSAAHHLTAPIDNHPQRIDDREHSNFDRADLAEGAALPAALPGEGPISPLANVRAAARSLVPQRETPRLHRPHGLLAEGFVRVNALGA